MAEDLTLSTSNGQRRASFSREVLLSWWRDYRDSFFFVFLPSAAGMSVVVSQSTLDRATAALWALACLAAGSLVGFLFGVPKVISNERLGEHGEDSGPLRPAYLPNTNLDNISDWLTKAIVGVGLVQLGQIPDQIMKAAKIVAGEDSPSATSAAAALIVLFLSMGLIGGYVNTRLYFAAAFEKAENRRFFGMGWTLQGVKFTYDDQQVSVGVDGNNLAWKCPTPDCDSQPLLFVYQSGRVGSGPASPVTCSNCSARYYLDPPYQRQPPAGEIRNPARTMRIVRLADEAQDSR